MNFDKDIINGFAIFKSWHGIFRNILHDMGSGDQQKKTVLAILFWHIVFAQPFLVLVSVWCDLFCSSVLLEIMVRSPTKKEVTNRVPVVVCID